MKAKKKNRHREFLLRRRRRRREELPHDVVVEILKRLPVRSLLRFGCVSRSWRSTIDDPHFAALHWSHFPLDARDRYLACLDWEYREQRLCSLIPDIPDQSLARHSLLQIEIPFFTPANSYRLVGSCDGLIFVEAISKADSGQTMYLWNPFTGNHKAVPRSGLEHQRHAAVYEVLGLGFDARSNDARSNDYKIVKILYFSANDGIEALAEIYSLRTDSWRSLKSKFPTLRQDEPAIFFNQKLHWFATICGEDGYRSIVSFDLADEVINEMALPLQISQISQVNTVNLQMYMAVLDNLLAVFISFNRTEDLSGYPICSVWVMREYGMPKSWTRRNYFKFRGDVTGFDGFTRNGELLIKTYRANRVSLTTKQCTELPIWTSCNLVAVVESLHLNLEEVV